MAEKFTPQNIPAFQNSEHQMRKDTLSPQYGSKILFHSFTYSQGNVSLQQDLFDYIHLIRPAWRMNNGLKQEIFENALPSVAKRLKFSVGNNEKHELHPKIYESIPMHLDARLQDFQKSLEKNIAEKDPLIEKIAIMCLLNDFHFLVHDLDQSPRGRPRRNEGEKWLSQLCHFGMNDAPTGLLEFDEMFDDVRQAIKNGLFNNLDRELDAKLSRVTEIYNSRHPTGRKRPAFTVAK